MREHFLYRLGICRAVRNCSFSVKYARVLFDADVAVIFRTANENALNIRAYVDI